jgi:hypothetical protein
MAKMTCDEKAISYHLSVMPETDPVSAKKRKGGGDMAFGASEIIMFGINAGVRLYGQARQAYVEKTRERELVIPLPGLPHSPTVTRAFAYFKDNMQGKQFVAMSIRLAELHEMAKAGAQAFKDSHPEEAKEYVDLYVFYRLGDDGKLVNEKFLISEVVALNTLAQWRRGETPHPTALRRIAGTVTEIGIDFFATGPGAGKLAGNTPTNILLREVLLTLDNHSFVSEGLEGTIEKVFIATLDAIEENPTIISGDPKVQKFVSGVAGGVVEDIQDRIDNLPENQRLFAADRLSDVARAVFRSVVRNGADMVLDNPETFLGTQAGGESEMASKIGKIVLNTVLPEGSTGTNLSAIATGETLDKLVKGALSVLAEHPDLMGTDHPGIEMIVQEVATKLANQTERIGPDLFPDVAQLVLEKTAKNLELFWKPEGDAENLAVTAVGLLLGELASKPDEGKWKPKLSKSQVLNVVEAVLDDLAANPAIITRKVNGKPAVDAAIAAILAGLVEQKLEHFSSESAAKIAVSGLKAATDRWEMLEPLGAGADAAKLAINAVIDTVFAGVTAGDEKAAWRLTQGHVLVAIFDNAFIKLADHGVDDVALGKLNGALEKARQDLEANGRFSIDMFASDLESRLAA